MKNGPTINAALPRGLLEPQAPRTTEPSPDTPAEPDCWLTALLDDGHQQWPTVFSGPHSVLQVTPPLIPPWYQF